ncbi:hypothetical protein ABEX25_25720 [Paenibacillus thiaminolyticus]|uniref:hypothetical protein n=1 Tax=Paenibacillus thiaminolyticus TaxID=49283 RepID=UPI003D27DDFB
MKKIFAAMITVLLLAGCSSQRDLSRADLCVQRGEDKAQICYGMERAEVEKVAGKGEVSPVSSSTFWYENDLSVTYRNGAVVGLRVFDGVYYEHPSGFKIGDLPDKLKEKYGAASQERLGSIAYIYDSKNKTMTEIKDDQPFVPEGQDPKDFWAVNVFTNNDGYISLWLVGDMQAALMSE